MWARIWVGWLGLWLVGMPSGALGSIRSVGGTFEPARTPNVQRGSWSYLVESIVPSRTKANELKGLADIPFRTLTREDFTRRIGVSGGEHFVVSSLAEGLVAGSTGAGPCIGVILIFPTSPSLSFAIFHFSATEDPAATIRQLGRLPYGTRAALFGGDNSPGSNFTLSGVMHHLRGRGIAIEGYSDSVGLWVDNAGRFYRFTTDVDSTNE